MSGGFFGGFAGGLTAGTNAAGKWQENYKRREEEEVTNKLFTAGQQLATEGAYLDAEGQELQGMGDAFSNASADDMAGMMMKQLVANGGKIDDNTARLAYGTAEQLVGLRQKGVEHNQKKQLFQAKMSNYESMIGRRNVLNTKGDGSGGGSGGGVVGDDGGKSLFGQWVEKNGYSLNGKSKTMKNKLFGQFMKDKYPETDLPDSEKITFDDEGNPDLKSIKVGGKLFKSLTSDVQRTVQEAHGFKGTAAPKPKGEFDGLFSEPEAAPTTEKRKSSGNAPKGVKNGKYTVKGKKVEVIDGVMYPL